MQHSIPFNKVVLVTAFAVLATGAQAQNLLVNGDFSTGSLAPWVPFTTPNGTDGHAGLPNVLSLNNKSGGVTYVAHFNVGEVTFDQTPQGGGINQVVLVNTAGTYTCFANIGSQNDKNGKINGDAGTFSILIDGTTVITKSLGAFDAAHQNILGTLSGTVTLAAGSHTFEVLITRTSLAATSGGNTPNESVTDISLSLNPLDRPAGN